MNTKPRFVRTRTGIEIGRLHTQKPTPAIEHYRKPVDPDAVVARICIVIGIGLIVALCFNLI